MAKLSMAQRRFAGGELSPALYGRVDVPRHGASCKTIKNAFIQKHGGLANRPGTHFVAEVKDSATAHRLIPFRFSSTDNYVLLLGDEYMRFMVDGATITISTPATYAGGTTYEMGDLVVDSGVNYYSKVDANLGNTPASSADEWYAMPADDIFEIPTPWAAEDLRDLQYVQSADVITFAHDTYQPHNLTRYDLTDWTLVPIKFEPGVARPTGLTSTVGETGSLTFKYKVTAIKGESFEESLPATTADFSGTSTLTMPSTRLKVTTSVAHNLENGDDMVVTGLNVTTEPELEGYLVDREFEVSNKTSTTFELQGTSDAPSFAGSPTIEWAMTQTQISSADDGTVDDPHDINWSNVTGAIEYWVYRADNGNEVYGYIGKAKKSRFFDTGLEPDEESLPPEWRNPFDVATRYPTTVTYVQQRLGFANTNEDPTKIYLSRVGDFYNLTIRNPLQDDDALTFVLAGREVNKVQHVIESSHVLILTSGGEWAALGNADGVLLPGELNLRQYGYNGASSLAPVVLEGDVLYVQARRSVVRRVAYNFSRDRYDGEDLTVFSSHLFEGRTIDAWTYAQSPNSIVWAVRSDGALLSLTYLPVHEITGWTQHDTGASGVFEDVVAIPLRFETSSNAADSTTQVAWTEDAVYTIVKRTIDGSDVRYVEYMGARKADDPTYDMSVDAFFVDSGLTYDGRRGTYGGYLMGLSGGPPWTAGSSLTLEAGSASFVAGDVGNKWYVEATSGANVTVTVTGFSTSTQVTVTADADVPAGLQGTLGAPTISIWTRLVDGIAGLDHLEGETVSVLADGVVFDQQVVTSGAIDLELDSVTTHAGVVHVGLPFDTDVDMLDIDADTGDGRVFTDRAKSVERVVAIVNQSRPFSAGTDADNLEVFEPEVDGTFGATELYTGQARLLVSRTSTVDSGMLIRQSDPVPFALGSVIRTFDLGEQ